MHEGRENTSRGKITHIQFHNSGYPIIKIMFCSGMLLHKDMLKWLSRYQAFQCRLHIRNTALTLEQMRWLFNGTRSSSFMLKLSRSMCFLNQSRRTSKVIIHWRCRTIAHYGAQKIQNACMTPEKHRYVSKYMNPSHLSSPMQASTMEAHTVGNRSETLPMGCQQLDQ